MSKTQFNTDRLKHWRTQELRETFTKTLNTIEQHGCQVLYITPDFVTPSFSYTAGCFNTGGKHEFITIGLQSGTAHHALNEAVRRERKGEDLTEGRHSGLVGDVDVEFRPVDPRWLHHIMLRTDWFYEGQDVPVLQLVYPDLENRFPDEPDFDVAFAQPFLSGGQDETESVASDLWAAYDSSSSLSRWKFQTSPHASAYLSQTVFNRDEAITYVSHDDDGAWQFLGDKMSHGGGPVLTCLHHPIDSDPTLESLYDLPLNWYATREHPEAAWQRFEHPPAEDDDDEQQSPDSALLH